MHRYSDILNGGLLEDMDALENYAEYSHSSINYLLLEVLGIHDEQMQYIASHVGVASGIMSLLRGFAHHSANVSTCPFFPIYAVIWSLTL